MDTSPTLALHAAVQRRRMQGESVHDLGFGGSPFSVPKPMQDAARAAIACREYGPAEGHPDLRAAFLDDVRQRTPGYEPTRTMVAPGTKILFLLAMMAAQRRLILPSPSWVSYRPQAEIAGIGVDVLDTRIEDDWKLRPDVLESAPRGGLLLLNSPNNPTGTEYTDAELKALAEVAEERGHVVLSDEIYGRFGQGTTIAKHLPDATMVSDGISKWAGAGGWRLGCLAVPEPLAELHVRMVGLASETYSCTSLPMQAAAVPAFDGTLEAEWHRRRDVNAAVLGAAHEALASFDVPRPTGAFYCMPRLPVDLPSQDLCAALMEQHIATLPGTAFLRPAHEPTLRLALVDYDPNLDPNAFARASQHEKEALAPVLASCRRLVEAVAVMGEATAARPGHHINS